MGFGCTREDVPSVMSLFAEVIQTPALPEPKLELLKAQVWRSHPTLWQSIQRQQCDNSSV